MMIVLKKTVIVVKVVRRKTSRQVSKSSYCSIWDKLGHYLKPTGSHDLRERESGRDGERERGVGGIGGFARLGGHS